MALGQTGGPMTLALFHNLSFCESRVRTVDPRKRRERFHLRLLARLRVTYMQPPKKAVAPVSHNGLVRKGKFS